jgi:hypothetical protein
MEGGYCLEGESPSIRTSGIWLSGVLSLLGRVCSPLRPAFGSLGLNIFGTKNWSKVGAILVAISKINYIKHSTDQNDVHKHVYLGSD